MNKRITVIGIVVAIALISMIIVTTNSLSFFNKGANSVNTKEQQETKAVVNVRKDILNYPLLFVEASNKVTLMESTDHVKMHIILPSWQVVMPANYSNFINATDESGKNVWDYSKQFSMRDARILKQANCSTSKNAGNQEDKSVRDITFSDEVSIPIQKNLASGIISVNYDMGGIRPTTDNVTMAIYELKFASFYDTEVKLPDEARVLQNTIDNCSIDYNEFHQIFFHDVKFDLR